MTIYTHNIIMYCLKKLIITNKYYLSYKDFINSFFSHTMY